MKTLTEQIRGDLAIVSEATNFPDYTMYDDLEDYIQAIEQVPVNDLVDAMNKDSLPYEYYPSGWHSEFADEYPGHLAEALVQTHNAESTTDLWNVYYSNRKLSDEAHSIFARHAASGGDTTLKDTLDAIGPDDFLNDRHVKGLYSNEPKLFQKIAEAQLDEDDYAKLFGRKTPEREPEDSAQQTTKSPTNITDIDSAIVQAFVDKGSSNIEQAVDEVLWTIFSGMFKKAGIDPRGISMSFYHGVITDYVAVYGSQSERRVVLNKAFQKINQMIQGSS